MSTAPDPQRLRSEAAALVQTSRSRILGGFEAADVLSLDATAEGAPAQRPRADNLEISLSDGYLPEGERRFDYLLFVLLAQEGVDGERPLVLVAGPDALTAFAELARSGRRTNSVHLWRGPEAIRSLGAVLYRAPRALASHRLMREIAKLGSALDYRRDYPGSVKLGKTLVRHLETLNDFPGVERLLGGVRDLDGEPGRERFLAFLADGMASRDERQLWIVDQQLNVGSSREIAIPWRYAEYCLLRVGPEPEGRGAIRSITALRSQYALTAGAIGKEEDKSVVREQLEKEARLRQRRELTYRFGRDSLKRFPIVTPIALEVAADLIPIVESEQKLSPRFQELIDMMRDGLQHELGHERLPGVRVRGNEADMPAGSYLIMLSEIPLVMGTVSLDKVLVNDTVASLRKLNIEGEVATNPANGRENAWIPAESASVAEGAGLTTWDAAGYLTLHLSAVLRKNFADFVTLENVVGQVQQKAASSFSEIASAPGGFGRFTGALKALAEEEVKLTALDEVCRRYLSLQAEGTPLYEIIEELRMIDELRRSLPGNRGERESTAVYVLDDDLVTQIRDGILQSGDTARLALEPEPTQEILSAVRSEVGSLLPTMQNPVICVEDWRIRRHFRRLVELEFRHLAVMAEREFEKPLWRIARIGLE
ncbi:MAG: FHIPEP family type III secretion protein [Myxococcota bacterium]|nr:FHIPEP family type III secretion protein [Myxococcota bacterium]